MTIIFLNNFAVESSSIDLGTCGNAFSPTEIINTRDLNASIQLLIRVLLHRNIGRVLEP